MKKIITLSIVAMLFTITQSNAQITFGVKGGFSLASLQAKGEDDFSKAFADAFNDTKKWLPAFHGGVTADIPLSENLVIQPALQFAQKGAKTESGSEKTKLTLNYLELPVNVLYRQSADGGFYGGVGPYIGYALSGKSIFQDGDLEEKEDVNFDEDGIKRLDAGGNIMVGYELPMGVTVGANYSLGFTNILDKDKNAGVSFKTSYIGLSIGYKFKK
jgi:hypothetical protein